MSYAARASRFLAERRGPAAVTDATPVGTTPDEQDEINEINEERGAAVWWPDPALRLLPPAADDFDRSARAAYAPIIHLPPPGCLGPVACARLGPCDRRAAGRPCLSAAATGEDAS